MLYLNPEFQRKYGPVIVEKDRLQVVLNPNSWGRNIFLDEGVWSVRNDFVAVIMGDLLKALGIDLTSPEAKKIRQRVLTISDNQINIEFILPQEVKARYGLIDSHDGGAGWAAKPPSPVDIQGESSEKTLWENKWLEVYEKDGWYTCVRSTVGDGVMVLPYRTKGNTWEILIRCEHTPCHEDGVRVKGKFNKTSLTGQIEKGYDPISTAEKELYEESGYSVAQKDFLDLGWVYPTKHSDDKSYLYAVNLDGAKEPAEIKGDGTKGEDGAWCEWVSLEEAIGLPSNSISACIARLAQQHKINFGETAVTAKAGTVTLVLKSANSKALAEIMKLIEKYDDVEWSMK